MPSRGQFLRSSVAGSRPASGTREVGELYVNFADRQIGYIDAAKAPIDLLAIKFFSTAAAYVAGDIAAQAGQLYRAKGSIPPGAFAPANWDAYVVQSGLDASLALKLDVAAYTAADVLTKIKTVDGTGSGLDADLLDGQDGAYYLALGNATGAITDAQHGNRGGGLLHAAATAAVAGFMTDAASDGITYGRKNGAWAATAAGLPEAPVGGLFYVRQGSTASWVQGYDKAGIDTLLAGKVNDTGDTLTGPLVLPGNPANALEAAPKQYVDTKISSVVETLFTSAGGTQGYTKPAGLKFLEIEGCAPGGSGGGALATSATIWSFSAAGGAGSWSRAIFPAASVPASLTITIGAVGAGSANGGVTGGTSSFGALMTLPGGTGGTQGSNTTGSGNAVTPQSSAPTVSGAVHQLGFNGAGSDYTIVNTAGLNILGRSGSNMYGGPSTQLIVTAATQLNGGPGQGYGSGSSGCINPNSQAAKSSLDARPGFFMIREYF